MSNDIKSALLLVDIQNDYFKGGQMELVSMENAAINARKLLERSRAAKTPIFHIQHVSTRPGATFFLPNTHGVEINDLVKPLTDEAVITKHYPNSFRDTPLHDLLTQQSIKKLIICGAMSHMCIDTTTRAAFDLGYKSVVVSDACATKELSFNNLRVSAEHVHAAYMAGLNGLFAEVWSHDSIQSR